MKKEKSTLKKEKQNYLQDKKQKDVFYEQIFKKNKKYRNTCRKICISNMKSWFGEGVLVV